MKIKYVIDIMIVLFLIFAGYTQISKGVAYGVSKQKYTKKSIIEFSKPMGLLTWLFAFSVALIFVGQSGLLANDLSIKFMYAGDFFVIMAALIYYYLSRKILQKKKAPMGYTYKKNNRKL